MKDRAAAGVDWVGGATAATVLAIFVLVRVLFALLVLARSPGRVLPGFPHYRYNPLPGDAYGYYSAARDLIATGQRDVVLVGLVLAFSALAALAVVRLKRGPALRTGVAVWTVGALAAVLAGGVKFTGAAQVGWPLVWSIPLLPLRALGALNPDSAFAVGLVLSLACNAVTVVAAYLLGRGVGLRVSVALVGAGLFAFWPVLVLLAGSSGSRNGTWQIDLGLSLYTEPLSTALVLVALVMIVRESSRRAVDVLTGALLGSAILVRLTNVLILACVLMCFVIWRERRRAAVVALGALAFAPAALLFWPKSYPKLKPPVFPAHPFGVGYASGAWEHSLLWHPSVVAVLLPLALVGTLRAARRPALLLWSCVAATAAFYTFYSLTPIHPRFLFVVLPIVLLFWAAGAAVVVHAAATLYDRPR